MAELGTRCTHRKGAGRKLSAYGCARRISTRRPDHAEKGRTRERVRASSTSCLYIADQCGAQCSAGSPPRDQSAPRQGPPPRRVDPSSTTRGRQGRRDKREREGTPDGREAVFADHRSDGINVFHRTRARGHLGHRQPRETCAREAEVSASQGTNAVHGTWCSEGEAGRHLRTKAG